MAITTRSGKGAPVTNAELDENFLELKQGWSDTKKFTTTANILNTDSRKLLIVDSEDITLTLPDLATVTPLETFEFIAYYDFTLAVTGTDTIQAPSQVTAVNSNISIYSNTTFTVTKAENKWVITSINSYINGGKVHDYGNVSGAITIDLSYSAVKFNCTGNVTVSFANAPQSGVNRPTAFYITRNTASAAVVTWPANLVWKTPIAPSLADLQTTIASVATINGGTSYFGFPNAQVYEITGSGLATTWNPSDQAGAPLVLSDGNTTIEMNPSVAAFKMARAFGGKSSGKWRIPLLCVTPPATNTGAKMFFGITDAGLPLSSAPGYSATSFAVTVNGQGSNLVSKVSNSVFASLGITNIIANKVLALNIDLDANKMWITLDLTVLGGGAPEAGTGENFSLPDGVVFFPAISLYESGYQSGKWQILNEVQDPYASNWPSFQNWTA